MLDRRTFVTAAGATAMLSTRGLAAATQPIRIPMQVTDSRILVDCTIGGSGPLRFVLDTGGTIGLIELREAARLKLRQIGSSLLGLKQGTRQYPIYAAPEFTFGGTARQPVAAIAGVDNVAFLDDAIGSIAAGALTSTNGELDFDTSEWLIHPQAPDYAGWNRVPNAIFRAGNVNGSAFMAADASLSGQTFRFGLDTGMPTEMRIYRKAAEKAGLWRSARWSPTAPGGQGRQVRAELDFAGERLKDVIVTITNDPDFSIFPNGIIGLPILRRFNIATNGQTDTIYLKRNRVAAPQSRYNRSGLWVDRAGDALKVGAVGPGSPAANNGIQPGDRISGISFSQFVAQSTAAAGTVIPLTVERAGSRRQVYLKLEDYL